MATLTSETSPTTVPRQSTAVSTIDIAALRQGFDALSQQARLGLMIGLAAVVAIAVALLLWSRATDYRVLFSNLNDKDGGAIVTALTQMNVPYKLADNSGAVLVPSDKVHDARLKLALQGLPRGGNVGFELMENQKFGITQFQEQVNYQRALEGELARSIQSLGQVQGARVHLAIPKPSVFLRDQQKPTASVLVTLHPAKTLDRAQVSGIVHLVSSSVPELNPKNVSIVDQNGALISGQAEGDARLDPKQLLYIQQVEASVQKRINDILEPVLGRTNFRAQVNADVDFTESESTDERYKPNSNPTDSTVRSTQSSESSSTNPSMTAAGIPGSLTNQPPAPAQAQITGPGNGVVGQNPATTRPGGPLAQNDTLVRNPNATQRSTVTNFEVDKTVRHRREATGAVKRLSAAVVLNHRKAAGATAVAAIPEKELDEITALVREAMGFRTDRGDSLKVTSAPFSVEEAPESGPLWKRPETLAFAAEMAKYLFVLIVFAYLIFGVLRPTLRQLSAPKMEVTSVGALPDGTTLGSDGVLIGPDGQPLTTHALESSSDPDVARALRGPDRVKTAREIAEQDPKLVANVVRNWIHTGSNNE